MSCEAAVGGYTAQGEAFLNVVCACAYAQAAGGHSRGLHICSYAQLPGAGILHIECSTFHSIIFQDLE